MKKVVLNIISFLLTFSIAGVSSVAFAADDISVVFNNEKVVFNNAKPTIIENRTLIPVRAVFEKAGWKVDWIAEDKTAIIGNDKKVVFITINQANLQLYDVNTDTQQEISLDVPATIINDSTMVPLRAVCEAMGTTVNWDNKTRTVYIER